MVNAVKRHLFFHPRIFFGPMGLGETLPIFCVSACWGKGVKNVKSVVEGLKHCVYAMIGCPAPCFEVIFCEIRARIRGRGGR